MDGSQHSKTAMSANQPQQEREERSPGPLTQGGDGRSQNDKSIDGNGSHERRASLLPDIQIAPARGSSAVGDGADVDKALRGLNASRSASADEDDGPLSPGHGFRKQDGLSKKKPKKKRARLDDEEHQPSADHLADQLAKLGPNGGSGQQPGGQPNQQRSNDPNNKGGA